MNTQTITQMLRALRPALKDQARASQILERFWSDRIALVWTTRQIHRAANEKKTVLTEGEARQILHELHQQHNHQYGLRWSDLGEVIANSCLGRPITRSELNGFINQDIITIQPSTKGTQ